MGQDECDGCTAFLTWALPRLRLSPPGFRRVRAQVCKRLRRRMQTLGVAGWEAYRPYLEENEDEWRLVDEMCRISVSRFHRDAEVFAVLRERVLPALARSGGACLRIWSAGCASGEEPYTLALTWRFALASRFPGVRLQILGTDADARAIERARTACYRRSSLKELPAGWLSAFQPRGPLVCLQTDVSAQVELQVHDLRAPPPGGPFDMVLCRNLVFTYFAEPLRTQVAQRLVSALRPGGVLVTGAREEVNHADLGLRPVGFAPGLFSAVTLFDIVEP